MKSILKKLKNQFINVFPKTNTSKRTANTSTINNVNINAFIWV